LRNSIEERPVQGHKREALRKVLLKEKGNRTLKGKPFFQYVFLGIIIIVSLNFFNRACYGWESPTSIFAAAREILDERISAQADEVSTWQEDSVRVFFCTGAFRVTHGTKALSAKSGVIWFDEAKARAEGSVTIDVYLEGEASLRQEESEVKAPRLFLHIGPARRFTVTVLSGDHKVKESSEAKAHPLYARAEEAWKTGGIPKVPPPPKAKIAPPTPPVEKIEEAPPAKKVKKVPAEVPPARKAKKAPPTIPPVKKVEKAPPKVPPVKKVEKAPPEIVIELPPEEAAFLGRVIPPKEAPILIYARDASGFRSKTWEEPDGTRIVVLTGGVDIVTRRYKPEEKVPYKRITYIELTADNIVLFIRKVPETTPTGQTRQKTELEAYAEGNVVIYQNELEMRGKRIYIDIARNQALIVEGSLTTYSHARKVPVIYRAKRVRMYAEDYFAIEKAQVTTCDYARPHIWVSSSSGEVSGRGDERVATIYNNVVFLEGMPIFYWPVLSKRLKSSETPLKTLRISHNSRFGTRLITVWDLYDLAAYENTWSDLYMILDLMSNRGVGIGLDFKYKRPGSYGFATGYFLNDSAPEIEAPLRDNEFRGRFRWQHRQYLPHNLQLDLEYHYISDRNFLNEFYEEEFEEDKPPESYAYLKWQDNIHAITLLERLRVNPFQSQVEYNPQIAGYVIGQPLLGDNLTYFNRTEFSNVRYRPDHLLTGVQSNRVLRVDSRNEIYWPMHWSIFNVDPFAGFRLSAFDNSPSGAVGRNAFVYGVRANTYLYRNYDCESDLFNIHGLRHIIIPQLNYTRVFGVNNLPAELYQMDEIETVTNQSVLSIGLRQRLQTKRQVRSGAEKALSYVPQELALFDVRADFYPNPDRDNNGQAWGNIRFDSAFYATNRVSLLLDGEYNPSATNFEIFNVGVLIDHSPKFNFYVGSRFSRLTEGNNFIFKTEYEIDPKWKVAYYIQHDFEASAIVSNRLAIQRVLHCWLAELSIEREAGADDGKSDTTFSLLLMPVGLPEAKLRF